MHVNPLQRSDERKLEQPQYIVFGGNVFDPHPLALPSKNRNILQVTYNILHFSGVSLGDVGRRFFEEKHIHCNYQWSLP